MNRFEALSEQLKVKAMQQAGLEDIASHFGLSAEEAKASLAEFQEVKNPAY